MRTTRQAASSYAAAVSGSNALQPHPRPKLSLVEGGRSRVSTVTEPARPTVPMPEPRSAHARLRPTPRPRSAQAAAVSAPSTSRPGTQGDDAAQVELIGPETSRWLTFLVALSAGVCFLF
jgi:hypothetical protein